MDGGLILIGRISLVLLLSTVLLKASEAYYSKFQQNNFSLLCRNYLTLIGCFHMESFLCYRAHIHNLCKLHEVPINWVPVRFTLKSGFLDIWWCSTNTCMISASLYVHA